MTLNVNVEGLEGLKGLLAEIRNDLISGEILERMAMEAKDRVLERTSTGKDFENKAFAPYSKAYGKAREKRGLPGTTVDLRFTGEMLDDLTTSTDPAKGESTVFFKDGKSARKALSHDGPGAGGVRRRFLGLSSADRHAIREMLEEHIGEVIKDAY
ncbi:MAG: hypothetical protein ACE5GY_09705 [Thermodesulfobacteriota bacterium]